MAMSKKEKVTAARKNAEAQKATKKQNRDTKLKTVTSVATSKGKKPAVKAPQKKK
jgi:hypothetical protein